MVLVHEWLHCKNVTMGPEQVRADDSTQRAPEKRGLGDLTESFFTSLGITKERYQAAKAGLGLDPGCNCDARKKWLNELGGKLGVDAVVLKMAKWLDRRKDE